jgi:LCP family protein required for cell wall assembly
MSPRRSILRAFSGRYLIALIVAAAVMVGSVISANIFIDRKIASVKRVSVKTAPPPPQGANYLLLGSDSRSFVQNATQQKAFGNDATAGGQRSDTMMVIHVEPGSKKTLIVSFPRDLWVNIPGMGMGKINGAFNAGPNKVIEMLKADFNVNINHFIEVDFQSFQGVVNAIGRVPVYFPYPARDLETGLHTLGGCELMDGSTSLSYTRSRELQFFSLSQKKWMSADGSGDIGRINRQQQFIRELAGIAVQRSLEDPITANDVVNSVLSNLTIDQSLSKDDILTLIDAFRTVNPNDTSHLDFQTLPWSNGPQQSGQDVLYVQQPAADAVLAELQSFTSAPTTPAAGTVTPQSVKVQVVDGTGKPGLAQGALNDLVQKGGFQSGGSVAALAPVPQSEVRYKPGSVAKGELVLEYLNPAARLVEDPTIKGAAEVSVVLGRDFQSIVLPSAGGAVTGGTSNSSGPVAGPPPSSGDTAQTSGGTPVSAAVFGQPIPITPPCH